MISICIVSIFNEILGASKYKKVCSKVHEDLAPWKKFNVFKKLTFSIRKMFEAANNHMILIDYASLIVQWGFKIDPQLKWEGTT